MLIALIEIIGEYLMKILKRVSLVCAMGLSTACFSIPTFEIINPIKRYSDEVIAKKGNSPFIFYSHRGQSVDGRLTVAENIHRKQRRFSVVGCGSLAINTTFDIWETVKVDTDFYKKKYSFNIMMGKILIKYFQQDNRVAFNNIYQLVDFRQQLIKYFLKQSELNPQNNYKNLIDDILNFEFQYIVPLESINAFTGTGRHQGQNKLISWYISLNEDIINLLSYDN